jgi:hypothetical protein
MAAASCFVALLAVYGCVDAARIKAFDDVDSSPSLSASFDWSKNSCDVDTLTAEDLATAVDAKKSGSGNMGGVYFLTLSGPDCNVVIKPRLDLHDAYASSLGTALGAPVAKTRLLSPQGTPEKWSALLESFDKFDSQEAFLSTVEEGSGFAQIMGVAEGKDLYEMTDPTLGWEACNACLGEGVLAGIRKGLSAVDNADIPVKLAAKMAKSINRDTRLLCKNMWTHFSADADKAARFWGKEEPPRWCPKDWRESDEFAADVQEYYDTNTDDVMSEMAFAYANGPFRTLSGFCPASKRPLQADVDGAKQYTQLVMNSASTRADIAKLSAFTSLIAENDGMSAMGYTSSNYHNVFFSPLHATGIDMAVGGALTHERIKPDEEGKFDPTTNFMNVAGGIAFMYEDVTKAAHLGTCGTEEELKAFAGRYANKMQRPYVGDRELNYQECAKHHGHTAPLPVLIDHGVDILRAWPAAMQHILDHADAAIATVRTEFSAPNELADAIQTFLDFHLGNLKKAFDEGIEACTPTE